MSETRIRMKRDSLEDLPPVALPEGCTMRTYQPGDEQVWAEIMNTGVGSDWTFETVVLKLTSQPQFDPEGLFFVSMGDEIVGSACAWRVPPEETETGIVHMVCVLPEARGKNLGYIVTLAVLHYFRDHGFKSATLSTDDFRLPAVKSYLRLGFEAICESEEEKERWERVLNIVNSDQ